MEDISELRQAATEHFQCDDDQLVIVSDEWGTTYADGGHDRNVTFGVKYAEAQVTLRWSHVHREVYQ